ncbi:unnamed protein product [Darwinula stevensoni]|uniref:Uncharacterized protein n=1 Tax=Darwinula stevensoni TaxID=69355 RepID=A0A7R8ZZB8_9CRUS|nr:unnamed protein product [Darwinula stevensoni]CAG0883312.1 unnamed protein product [Darwinula stevensoni]
MRTLVFLSHPDGGSEPEKTLKPGQQSYVTLFRNPYIQPYPVVYGLSGVPYNFQYPGLGSSPSFSRAPYNIPSLALGPSPSFSGFPYKTPSQGLGTSFYGAPFDTPYGGHGQSGFFTGAPYIYPYTGHAFPSFQALPEVAAVDSQKTPATTNTLDTDKNAHGSDEKDEERERDGMERPTKDNQKPKDPTKDVDHILGNVLHQDPQGTQVVTHDKDDGGMKQQVFILEGKDTDDGKDDHEKDEDDGKDDHEKDEDDGKDDHEKDEDDGKDDREKDKDDKKGKEKDKDDKKGMKEDKDDKKGDEEDEDDDDKHHSGINDDEIIDMVFQHFVGNKDKDPSIFGKTPENANVRSLWRYVIDWAVSEEASRLFMGHVELRSASLGWTIGYYYWLRPDKHLQQVYYSQKDGEAESTSNTQVWYNYCPGRWKKC